MFRILQRDGLRFGVAIGHSLGEFSALVATGAVDFEDALRIVRRRGQEMLRAADANPGGMAAIIGLDDAVVEALCAEQDGVWPANFNCPGQVVVSGTQGRAGGAGREGQGRRRQARHLAGRSAAPSTRRSSQSALEPLREEFDRTEWRTPDPAFFSGCTVALRERRLQRAAAGAARLAGPLHASP